MVGGSGTNRLEGFVPIEASGPPRCIPSVLRPKDDHGAPRSGRPIRVSSFLLICRWALQRSEPYSRPSIPGTITPIICSANKGYFKDASSREANPSLAASSVGSENFFV